MSAKLITLDGEARRALERGLDHGARAVKITRGPKARKAVLVAKWGALTTSNAA
jgi:chaperonin GroEL